MRLQPRRVWQWLVLLLVTVVVLVTLEGQSLRDSAVLSWSWRKLSPLHVDQVTLIDGDGPILPSAEGRVLVTGGGGVIGKRVVRRLLHAGIPVTVLDTIFFDDEAEAIRADYPDADLDVQIGDIRNPSDLAWAMEGVKGVINLAAVSRVLWCLENQADCTDVNVRGAQMVIEALKGGWFIQASSREVYGNPETLPVEEDTPHQPANVYGKSKAEAEDVITSHVAKVTADGSKKINAIMLRLSNVYGSAKDHPERLIPAIMRNAISNRPIQMVGGDQVLDMVFVEDVVDAVSLAVTRLHSRTYRGWFPRKGHVEVFNVGTDTSTSAVSLIRKTMWLTNSSSPLRTIPADNRFPARYLGSTVKAASVLGYKARISIDEGLWRLATEFLEDTVTYLGQKQSSEPFLCNSPKQYSISDVLALDGCDVFVTLNENGEARYGNGARPDPHHRWGPAINFTYTLTPMAYNFKARALEADPQAAVISLGGMPFLFGETPTPGNEFTARVDPQTGYVKLTVFNGKAGAAKRDDDQVAFTEYAYRLTPICCPDKPAPWPFYREDGLASNILDKRISTKLDFDASQMSTMCTRLAKAEQYARMRLEHLKTLTPPITLQEAELPAGRAPDWRQRRNELHCTNLCDHPTLCVDTGDCMCHHTAACVPRKRFPFSDFANLPTLSYPPPPKEENLGDRALVDRVNRSSWLNLLNPDARRYFGSSPAWPPVTAVRDPDAIEEKKSKVDNFYVLRNAGSGCFSADVAMERGAQLISKPYKEGESLVFLPYYSQCYLIQFPSTVQWINNAEAQLSLSAPFDTADLSMTFTHDFGRCNEGIWYLRKQRLRFEERGGFAGYPEKERRTISWSPMGDLNSPCYYADQDVVIPSRTCLQDDLRAKFGDMAKVKPIRQRSVLAAFKGRTYFLNAGAAVRNKVACSRAVTPGRLEGGHNLEVLWQKLKQDHDYMQTINETVFCLLPRGTTGWATRTIDVIYGGCIPVLVSDQTHHPFWDVLDYSKFAVFVNEWDLQNLEDILLSYSWEELEELQANLMLVRDAFLYPKEPDMTPLLEEKSPFWFAIHSAWLRKLTKYPV